MTEPGRLHTMPTDKAIREMQSTLTPTERHLTAVYTSMCIRAKVPLYLGHVEIRPVNHLNAEVNFDTKITRLTTYDLQCLDKSDIKALLAHEVGHLKTFDEGWSGMTWLVVMFVCLMPVIVMHLQPLDIAVMVLIASSCILWDTFHIARYDEYRADMYGARLVGSRATIHLFQTTEDYERRQRSLIRGYVRGTVDAPLVCLHLLLILLRYDIRTALCRLHMKDHPPNESRIKHLQKYEEKQKRY